MHADGADFFGSGVRQWASRGRSISRIRLARRRPNTCFSGLANCGEAKFGGRANHNLFQHTHIPDNIAPNRAELENGIADNLARAVIGNISAAAGLEIFDAFLAKHAFAGKQMVWLAVAALRGDVKMLAEKQNVANGGSLAGSHDTFLQRVSLPVTDEPEVDNMALTPDR